MTGPGGTTARATNCIRRAAESGADDRDGSVGQTDPGKPEAGGSQLGFGRQTIDAPEEGEKPVMAGPLENTADEAPTGVETGLINTDSHEMFHQSSPVIAVEPSSAKRFDHLSVVAEEPSTDGRRQVVDGTEDGNDHELQLLADPELLGSRLSGQQGVG